ncbi:MAG: hypothetical protein NTZ56_07645 [Acidobacteria bacterium]|nr:hypothetical protein [Acidobacteriota bacterium]
MRAARVQAALGLVCCSLSGWAAEPELTGACIMQRLAENQQRGQELRRQIVYKQSVLGRMHRGNNKLAREEKYEFVVTPAAQSFERKMVEFAGRYERGGRIFNYDKPKYQYKDLDIDGELLGELVEEWTGDQRSRDGMPDEIFPLTAGKQKHYEFVLAGREEYQGHAVWKVTFSPRKGEDLDEWWAGEVLVDVEAYEPVLITSHQAKGIPMAVKILLGTDIRKMGFKVSYQKFQVGPEGAAQAVWLPSTWGGEFDVRVLFGYRRKISLSMRNSDFQRTQAASTVKFEDGAVTAAHPPSQP